MAYMLFVDESGQDSDLTTLIRVVDYVAYIIAWGVRFERMQQPHREELDSLATSVKSLRHRAVRERNGSDFPVWSFKLIDDLRSQRERQTAEP